jgi:putative phosphoribosyl transferase
MKVVNGTVEEEVRVQAGNLLLDGNLHIPLEAAGVVLFAHGSGSSRHSPRNRAVAAAFRQAGLGTLLFDLLSAGEEAMDAQTRLLRFDIALLATRLIHALDWIATRADTRNLPVGLFGSSTGAAAALVAAARRPAIVRAVVSRGGRPDLAGAALASVQAPTLLIVGENDEEVLELNRQAQEAMRCENELEMVPGATHLFEERGALEKVAQWAADWFVQKLGEKK